MDSPFINDPLDIYPNKYILDSNFLSEYPCVREHLREKPHAYMKCIHATEDMMYVKFLSVFADFQRHTYYEVMDLILPDRTYGNDKELFTNLECARYIVRDGKLDKKYAYKITDFGNEILKIAHENMVFHKLARWFMPKIGDSTYAYVIDKQLKDEACTYYEDASSKSILEMVEAFVNPHSAIHRIGSAYKFLRSFFGICNRSLDFAELITTPEVYSFLEEYNQHHVGNNYADGFLKRLKKVQKKWDRKKAKMAIA